MDTTIGAASPITGNLGGEQYSFKRLSKRSIATVKSVMESDPAERKYLTPFDVLRWASTDDGAIVVLAVSMGKAPGPGKKWEPALIEVGAMGSMVQRSTLAAVVVAESITTGETVTPLPGDEQRPDPTLTNSPKQ